ncbi:MAG: dihydrofolate reductase family protein [Pseudomonadota bacterium]|nr:RibD family protein [Gammaproteobacteria bacterium]MDQ3580560.1 dihydrofolate reductase family protein [Pseudomonadota bacterium]
MPTLIRLFPAPVRTVSLTGLYLGHASTLRPSPTRPRPYVYSNFIMSLDGRIALDHSQTGERLVPEAITNPDDWRLFQELAAQADAIVTSGRYLRQLARGRAQDLPPVSTAAEYRDLIDWRRSHGLAAQPAIVVLSRQLDFPVAQIIGRLGRPLYIATGIEAPPEQLRALETAGAAVLLTGAGRGVCGAALIEVLGTHGFNSICAIGGPGVLSTLLTAGAVDRLYLTHAHRLLGGESFDTLLNGPRLCPPVDFTLSGLHYQEPIGVACGQLFATYDRVQGHRASPPAICG